MSEYGKGSPVDDGVLDTEIDVRRRPQVTARRSARRVSPRVVVWAVVLAAIAAFPAYASSQYVDLAILVAIAAIGALGLSMVTGYAGQLSIGQAGLLGIGGFVAGISSSQLGLGFIPALVLGVLAGAVVGLILGLPAVRLRGLYLVMSTLGFHYVAAYGLTQYQAHVNATAALTGLTTKPPDIFGFVVDTEMRWFYLAVILAVLTFWFCHNVTRTRSGRAWVALRERDLAAAALGVNVAREKLAAFVLSSALAALAGVLLVYYNGAVSADTYTVTLAISYLVMIVIGGMGSNIGAILGAIFVIGFPRLLTSLFGYLGFSPQVQAVDLGPAQLLVFGVVMTAFLLYEPGGLTVVVQRVVRRSRRKAPSDPPAGAVESHALRAAPRATTSDLLVVEGLALTYQGVVQAVRDVSLSVAPGEIVALVGPNAAGKTSTLTAIAGIPRTLDAKIVRGRAVFRGERIDGMSPQHVAAKGVTLIPERRNTFPALRVEENLRASGPSSRRRDGSMLTLDEVYELFPPLAARRNHLAGYLSGGERQMLAIAMAMMGTTEMLMIDEMMLGLSPMMSNVLGGIVRRLRDERGLSVLIVEQNPQLVRDLADYVYVVDDGRIIGGGTPAELVESEEVERAYIGL